MVTLSLVYLGYFCSEFGFPEGGKAVLVGAAYA